MKPPKYTSLPDRFWSRVDEPDSNGCWIWNAGKTKGGYGRITIDSKTQYAHRLAYEDANERTRLYVLHHCDVRNCVSPKHLYAGTPADNMRDRDARGRHGIAKLNDKEVNAIRRLATQKRWTNKKLAELYWVSPQVVYNVVSGKTFKRLLE